MSYHNEGLSREVDLALHRVEKVQEAIILLKQTRDELKASVLTLSLHSDNERVSESVGYAVSLFGESALADYQIAEIRRNLQQYKEML